jgi:exopolyphosphatase/guanosine-5'-triphosphate,3'-diphosphate pyrophosphatase
VRFASPAPIIRPRDAGDLEEAGVKGTSPTLALVRRGTERKAASPNADVVAGVDLGSNSFHMVVGRVVDGHLHVVDRIREGVRLASGLDEKGQITATARERALACLERFGQRLRGMRPEHVRAVGTNTFRKARRARAFIRECEAAIGHPIEVLSGTEEARLIYLGVAHDLSDDAGRRLVVDIGGGSTECIVGEHFEPLEAHSLYMGCVSYSERFFAGGKLKPRAFEKARIAARLELRTIERRFRALGWEECRGSSGTIAHVNAILRENGWSRDGITAKGLKKLVRVMVEAGSLAALEIEGIDPSRLEVLPGGVAILQAVIEALGVERMRTSSGALREGLLYDLLGRIRHEDVRDLTIRRLCERYHVDTEHAARVERTALRCLEQTASAWDLAEAENQQLLSWAARLHEIGLSIAYTGYHKHSAYIVAHSNMPGFSVEDQQQLASLILAHRRKIPPTVLAPDASIRLALCVLLRLAVCLNRSRSPHPRGTFALEVRPRGLDIRFESGWLDEHPLTRADLEQEAERLETVGFVLRVK